MDMQSSTTNTIKNILAQVKNTSIAIGSFEGFAISNRQVVAIEEALEGLKSIFTPETSVAGDEEDSVEVKRSAVLASIRAKNIELAAAAPEDRPALNLQLGKLQSERARLDRLVAKLSSLST